MATRSVDAVACSQGLNISQRLAIGNALNKLKLDEGIASVYFWGKVQGKERDYFIAQSVKTGTKIEKSRFYSHNNGVTFAKLPELDAFIIENAGAHRGRFAGNPSLKLRDPRKVLPEGEEEFDDEEEEYADEDGDDRKAPERKLTEVERLAFVVDQIEAACCVVPKGAWVMTATGDIKRNAAFAGLSLADAGKLESFGLFRPPQRERTLAQIHRAGVANNPDFLDVLSAEQPAGGWALQVAASGAQVVLRSLVWPGFQFTAAVGEGGSSGAYFGTGEPNADLAFML